MQLSSGSETVAMHAARVLAYLALAMVLGCEQDDDQSSGNDDRPSVVVAGLKNLTRVSDRETADKILRELDATLLLALSANPNLNVRSEPVEAKRMQSAEYLIRGSMLVLRSRCRVTIEVTDLVRSRQVGANVFHRPIGDCQAIGKIAASWIVTKIDPAARPLLDIPIDTSVGNIAASGQVWEPLWSVAMAAPAVQSPHGGESGRPGGST